MRRLSVVLFVLISTGVGQFAHAAKQGDGFLSLKTISAYWDNTQYHLADSQLTFTGEGSGGAAVELSLPVNRNFNVGGEIAFHDWRVISDSANPGSPRDGYANVYMYTVLGRYKFTEAGKIRPSVGAGFGNARFSLHSYSNVILEGHTWQLNATVDLMMTPGTALAFSVVRASIDVDDAHNNSLKNTATIYQFALSFHF